MLETAIILLVNVGTTLLKKYIFPKYGKTGVQAIVFVLALIGALYLTFRDKIEGLRAVVDTTIAIFALAVSFYEVLLSKLSWFRNE